MSLRRGVLVVLAKWPAITMRGAKCAMRINLLLSGSKIETQMFPANASVVLSFMVLMRSFIGGSIMPLLKVCQVRTGTLPCNHDSCHIDFRLRDGSEQRLSLKEADHVRPSPLS